MVLYSNDLSSCSPGTVDNSFGVNRFDSKWIYHSDVDAVSSQFVSCLHGFFQGYTATNHGHRIIGTLTDNL